MYLDDVFLQLQYFPRHTVAVLFFSPPRGFVSACRPHLVKTAQSDAPSRPRREATACTDPTGALRSTRSASRPYAAVLPPRPPPPLPASSGRRFFSPPPHRPPADTVGFSWRHRQAVSRLGCACLCDFVAPRPAAQASSSSQGGCPSREVCVQYLCVCSRLPLLSAAGAPGFPVLSRPGSIPGRGQCSGPCCGSI